MEVNQAVQIHDGSNSAGAMFINEKLITGEIVKINEKSIRVHMSHMTRTTNGMVVSSFTMNRTATFTFWKTVGQVSYYKNTSYGLIAITK